jgi:hypothetical protein
MKKLYTLFAAAALFASTAYAQTVSITFEIDMTPFLAVSGNTIIDTQAVRIGGNFQTPNAWTPANSNYKLTRVGTTNVYSGTFDVDAAATPTMEFKFLSRNAWGACDLDQECLTGSCTNGTNDNRFIDLATAPAGAFRYTTFWDSCGTGGVTITPLSIKNINSNVSSLNIYPNPANESATLSYDLTSASVVSVDVFNALGQKVNNISLGNQAPGAYKQQLETSKLVNGIYFVRLNVNGTSTTTKLNINF